VGRHPQGRCACWMVPAGGWKTSAGFLAWVAGLPGVVRVEYVAPRDGAARSALVYETRDLFCAVATGGYPLGAEARRFCHRAWPPFGASAACEAGGATGILHRAVGRDDAGGGPVAPVRGLDHEIQPRRDERATGLGDWGLVGQAPEELVAEGGARLYGLLLLEDEEDAIDGEPRRLLCGVGSHASARHRRLGGRICGPCFVYGDGECAVVVVQVDLLGADVLGAYGDGEVDRPGTAGRSRLGGDGQLRRLSPKRSLTKRS